MLSKCLEAFPLHFSVLWFLTGPPPSLKLTNLSGAPEAFLWRQLFADQTSVLSGLVLFLLADWALISNSSSRSKAAGEVPLSGGKLETMAKLMLSADPCRRAHFGRMAMAQDRHLDSQHNILSWPLACFAVWASLNSHLDRDVARSLFWFQLNP